MSEPGTGELHGLLVQPVSPPTEQQEPEHPFSQAEEERTQHIVMTAPTSHDTEGAVAESTLVICELLYLSFPLTTSYLLQHTLIDEGKVQNLPCIYL